MRVKTKYNNGGNTMGFFKDFKEDLSQAVDEIVPGETLSTDLDDDEMVNTLEDESMVSAMGSLEDLFEETASLESGNEEAVSLLFNKPIVKESTPEVKAEPMAKMDAFTKSEQVQKASSEVAIITKGTKLVGNIESDGSIEVQGTIQGDISCNGKLVVTGVVAGNTKSAEFFADSAKMEGEIESSGTVKIGLGSVVVGNISATSAVIAGAIKGDIDVKGPVVVDTSAVIMGNIKSRSVQINNGAVIEGFCSQCYSDIDVASLFAEKSV